MEPEQSAGRCKKNDWRRQRRLVTDTLTRLIEAEERAREKDDASEPISREDLDAAGKGRLIDEANLEVYLTWRLLNAPEARAISLMEVAAMPESLRRDIMHLMSEEARIRKSIRRRKKATGGIRSKWEAKTKAKKRRR